MPCQDVTEIIRLTVDRDNRLREYALIKRTCGQGVGNAALLAEWLGGQRVDDILDMEPEAFLEAHEVEDDLEAFLTLKHLFAVQSALRVLVGQEPGGPENACAAASVQFDQDTISIDGRIAVDILTNRIKSCGGCKGCGKTKPPSPRRSRSKVLQT